MSSDIIARVLANFRKGIELDRKGHLLRAAENYGRAAEAARALGPDNLAAVDMQRCQADTLFSHGTMAADSGASLDPLILAAHRADCVALFSAAVAALERRREAGTLLPGKCTAEEEAWFAAFLREVQGRSAVDTDAWAPLVGYESFVNTADSLLVFLLNAFLLPGVCSMTQFQAFAQHIVHATDLMQLHRTPGRLATGAEVLFTERLSFAMASDLVARGLDARLVQLLTAAWQCLQQSGVLESRGILEEVRRHKQDVESIRVKHDAAVHAAITAPGLRTCALASCGAKEAHPQHFKRCSACQAVVYCSKEHQLEAWPAHKAACKAARKAKAAASESGAGAGAAS